MRPYFTLQLQLIQRQLWAWGVPPLAALLGGLLGFLLLGSQLLERSQYAAYLLLGLSLPAFGRLADQRRNDFLKIQFHRKTYRSIRAAENLLLAGPFLVLFLLRGHWEVAVLQLTVSVIAGVIPKPQWVNRTVPTPFSWQPFEFAIGFRKTWLVYLGCCFLALMGHLAANFSLMVFAMVLPALVAMSYYGKPEPGFFIWVHAFTPREFLHRKLRIAARHGILLLLPLWVYCLLVFPDQWWLSSLLVLLAMSYLQLMVVAKYAAYPEEIDLRRAFIMAIAMALPPILAIAFILFYRQAKRNLMLILP
jgi:hypothetical protein